MLIQTEERSCVRDTTNYALLMTDTHALHRARAARAAVQQTSTLRQEVDTLQSQVVELTKRLDQLLAKTQHG
jgi:uncharacterized protein YceH (UPF0502 family)